jgi:hypothetical protein
MSRQMTINEKRIEKAMEEIGHVLLFCTIPEFPGGIEKNHNISVRIPGIRAKI